jgi:hypothetical protein
MTTQLSNRVPIARIRQYQDLVKFHGLRFVNFKPKTDNIYGESFERSYYHVTVEADDMIAYNAFLKDWSRATTTIVEKVRPLSRWRRIVKFFRELV